MTFVKLRSPKPRISQSVNRPFHRVAYQSPAVWPTPEPSNSASAGPISIGPVDDQHERQADAVADAVVSGSGLRETLHSSHSAIQRVCAGCASEEEEVQRKPSGPGGSMGGQTSISTAAQITHLRQSGGRPLPSATNQFMTKRFDHDFSSVSVHTGAEANQLSQSLEAKAFTVGNDVFFGTNQFRPQHRSGQRLIAHELTHTLQQSRGASITNVQRGPLTIQRSSVKAKAPPRFDVVSGTPDVARRYSLEARRKDTVKAAAKRAIARLPSVEKRVAVEDLAKAPVILNRAHLGLSGGAGQPWSLNFWFEGTRLGLPGSPAPRPKTEDEIDRPGVFDFDAVDAARAEWDSLGVDRGLLHQRANPRPTLSPQAIEQTANRIVALSSPDDIASELIRLADHPEVLQPLLEPIWSQLRGLATLQVGRAFFENIPEPLFNRLATHPAGIEVISYIGSFAPRSRLGSYFGSFPHDMRKPIVTSCHVGDGNTCMNKIFKELDIMYGPDASETYLHRQGQDLADLEAQATDEKKYQKKRKEILGQSDGPEKTAALQQLDSKHASAVAKGEIRLANITQFAQSLGAAVEGKTSGTHRAEWSILSTTLKTPSRSKGLGCTFSRSTSSPITRR